MCGIAGFLSRHEPASAALAEVMLRTLEHRGPDAFGSHVRGKGAVGQTRLSVVDLVTGDPPIAACDGRIGAVLNGEIYNFQALRKELREDGHTLRTQGDTEVVAHLAEREAPADVARRLEGMFTFAVWDPDRERLIIGRDRVGKKPLYWWCDGSTFVFGSEIKALLAHPAVTADFDDSVIGDYLTFGYVPTPRTFYRGIQSVLPGHVLVVDSALEVTSERYWHPTAATASDGRRDEPFDVSVTRVRAALAEAVRRRLIADVPLGAFLSGGVDSSGVVALMAQEMATPVRTFTIGFEDDDGFDERSYARLVADRLGTDHTEFVVQPHAVDLVERLVWHHDQPFGDSSAIPTYLLSELTRGHVTVALSGDGGDEVFGGYERFAASLLAERYAGLPSMVRRLTSAAVSALPARVPRLPLAKARRWEAEAARGLPDALRAWVSYVPDDVRAALLPGEGPSWGRADYQAIWDATAGASTLDRLLLLNLRTYLLDDLLPKVDRTSMAHALEVRSPLLDTDLIELAFTLPPAAKVRGRALKRVLKEALRDLVPAEVLERPKQGFGVPLDRWFRDDLATYVASNLGSPNARVRQHLAPGAIDTVLAEHGSGRKDHGKVLWSLLTLETFLRREGW